MATHEELWDVCRDTEAFGKEQTRINMNFPIAPVAANSSNHSQGARATTGAFAPAKNLPVRAF